MCKYFLILSIYLVCIFANATEQAKIDLSHEVYDPHKVYMLEGEWDLYWKNYINPYDTENDSSNLEPIKIPTTRAWTKIKSDGKTFPSLGFASYQTQILLPKGAKGNFALRINRVKMNYALFANGKLISHMGTLNDYPYNLDGEENNNGVVKFYIEDGTTTLDLIAHVSNNTYHKGGLEELIKIGSEEAISRKVIVSIAEYSLMGGALFIMAMYHFGLWLRRRVDQASLYFSLFSFVFGIRALLTGDKVIFWMFPQIEWHLVLKLDLATAYISIPLMHVFISYIFPNEFNKNIKQISWAVLAVFIGILLFAPFIVVGGVVLYFELYFVLVLIHILYVSIRAYLNSRENSILFFVGFIFASITGVNDILTEAGVIHSKYLFHYGSMIFIYIQSTIQAYRFANAFQELELLKDTLEQQVAERTIQLTIANEESLKAHQETRLLSQSMTNLLEDERRIIARELHDDFGQNISASRLNSQCLKRNLQKIGLISEAEIANGIDLTLEVLYQKNRSLCRRLRPEIIDTLGLKLAIEELINKYIESGYKVVFLSSGDLSLVESKVALAIYRVIQEAITNIIKYAGVKTFQINISLSESIVSLNVEDRGIGFDIANAKGVGLISMRERITELDGKFQVHSDKGIGTSIIVSVPYKSIGDEAAK